MRRYASKTVVPDNALRGAVFPSVAVIARELLTVGGRALPEKNPVACAAELTTVAVIEVENLIALAREPIGRIETKAGAVEQRKLL